MQFPAVVIEETEAIEVTYEFHSAANLFPLMEVGSAAFGELVQDVRANGLLDPIELFEGKILDGRNRYRACQHAGVEPRFVTWSGDSPVRYVISKNLYRRHLTEDQRAAIAIELLPILEEEVKEAADRARSLTQVGMPKGTSGVDSPPTLDHPSRATAAEAMKVSPDRVKRTKAVSKAAPELLEEVKVGKTTLREAEKKVRKARKPRDNGISPTSMLPGQWVESRKPRADSTLGSRLLEAVNKGRELARLAIEIQEMELDLDDETILALKARLDSEAKARRKLSAALKAVLDRRKTT